MGFLDWARHFSGRQVVRGEDQLFSYGGSIIDSAKDEDGDAGVNILGGTTVPAGEVWVITAVMAVDQDSACDYVQLAADIGGDTSIFAHLISPAANEGLNWAGECVLGPGDNLFALYGGVVANDWLYWNAIGYKMTLEAL